ncbi:hypothetical protein [Streptomyces iconiensis]|uniref:Uncharacterized protein n=1 Tax=Streptomyces iconiensis TaxID=1384038 RepID=A0ABT6ZQA5_9ACTN|nr:hypothetical protein [Streptomyces iconiensis]MDJ1131239.1 hypothetical protein [Streptomyces iconiensis]
MADYLRAIPDPMQGRPADGPPGPCEDCGAETGVTRVPAVDGAGPVDACPHHITKYLWRSHDVGWLARRRAAVDGEPVEHARAVLLGTAHQHPAASDA